jgi:hypothetical protein
MGQSTGRKAGGLSLPGQPPVIASSAAARHGDDHMNIPR